MAESIKCQFDEVCKKSGVTACVGCKRYFCTLHLIEHRRTLEGHFQDLFDEQNSLSELLKKCTETPCSVYIYQLIEQWEKKQMEQLHDAVRHVRLTAEQMVAQDNLTMQRSCQQLASDLQEKFVTDNYHETDIEQFHHRLGNLRAHMENEKRLTIDSKLVDWADLVKVVLNESIVQEQVKKETNDIEWQPAPYREFNLEEVLKSEPRYQEGIYNYNRAMAVASDKGEVLWYGWNGRRDQRLFLLDRLATDPRNIHWQHGIEGNIKCLAWCSGVQRFLIISEDGLNTLDPTTLYIELLDVIKPEKNYNLCTALGNFLYLVLDGRHIEKYNVTSWEMLNQWNNVVENEFSIVHITMNETHIAFIVYPKWDVTSERSPPPRFELRDHRMILIRTLRTYGDRIYQVSSLLPNGDWLTGDRAYRGAGQNLNLHDCNGKKKAAFDYNHEIQQLLVLDNQTLAVQIAHQLLLIDY